jgi:hypothetical protein
MNPNENASQKNLDLNLHISQEITMLHWKRKMHGKQT